MPTNPSLTMSSTASPSAPRRRPIRTLFLFVLLIGGSIWGFRFVRHILTHHETEDAYVTGIIHTISSRIPGVAGEILVAENTDVVAGQPLVKLDTRDLDIVCDKALVAVQQAKAQVAQAEAKQGEVQAQNELAKTGVTLAKANLTRDQAHAAKAHRDLDRAESLKAATQGAISEASWDDAKSAVDTAEATLRATEASVEAAKTYILTAEAREKIARTEIDVAKSLLKAAEVGLKDAELQRSYATISAPIAGRISRKAVEVGNRIQAGQALFALVEPEVWVQANFKETQLTGLKVGAEVEILVDAVPGRKFAGRIDSFSAASGAQFALLPPDNATGNFTKVVQRVPVKIVFDAGAIADVRQQIRPGMSVVVSIPLKD